jgi:hypothetical protein
VVAQPPAPEAKVEQAPERESYGVLAPFAAITGKRPEAPPPS